MAEVLDPTHHATSKKFNKERARAREACRRRISTYIEQELGLKIDPQDVHLVPRPTDPYVWDYPDARERLFTKQLSKHNIGDIREISRELGVSIKVLPRKQENVRFDSESSRSSDGESLISGSPLTLDVDRPYKLTHFDRTNASQRAQSFTQQIQKLEIENKELRSRLADAESFAKEQMQVLSQTQADHASTTEQLRGLQSTLQNRNVEAVRRTRLVEAHERKAQEMVVFLRNWQSKLRALQDDMTINLSHFAEPHSPETWN